MPKQANESSIVRQWEMLKYIPKKLPGITASALTDKMELAGFPVSKRTIERDLRDLSKVFPIATNEESTPFGWYWIRDIDNEFGGCEVTEAVSLTLAEDVLKSILPVPFLKCLEQKFKSAREKLKELKDLPIANWSSKVRYVPDSFPFKPVGIRSDILETLQKALIENKQVDVDYDPVEQATKSYTLNPLGIVNMGARSYLLATIGEYDNVLQFGIQRFRKVSLTESSANTPIDFSMDDYIQSGAMQFGELKQIKFKAAITENLASYLEETKLSPDQKISWKGENYILTATVKYTWQFWFWLRSQGSGITVLSPKFVRDEMSADAKELVKNYEGNK